MSTGKLVTLPRFIARKFPDGDVSVQRVRAWINKGEWPAQAAEKRGRAWFIDLDRLDGKEDLDSLTQRLVN